MSSYSKELIKTNAALRRKQRGLLKRIDALKKKFKELHAERSEFRKLKAKWTVEALEDFKDTNFNFDFKIEDFIDENET